MTRLSDQVFGDPFRLRVSGREAPAGVIQGVAFEDGGGARCVGFRVQDGGRRDKGQGFWFPFGAETKAGKGT